jgi:capsular polysaccharide biosynthesis protein
MSELETGFRIGDVIAMVRRRLPIVVVAVVLGAIAGYLVFSSVDAPYSATSRVRVQPIKLDQFAADGREAVVDIATEKDAVKSDAVAEAVREQLDLEGENRAILSRVTVTSEEDSLVLQITYVGDTAKQAQAGANAVAQGYLEQRKASVTSTRDSAVAKLDEELAAAQAALTEAQAAFDAEPEGSAQKAQLRTQVQTLQSQLSALQTQRTQLAQFDPETVGTIVRTASLPPETTSKKAIGLGLGVFGLFVAAGLAVAWVVDRRDSLGGGRRRLEQLVPGANVRVLPGAEGGSASPAEVDTAIDRLAVELVAGHAAGKASSVLVVGAGAEPPLALAEELASSLAFAGIPALFVLAGSSEREPRQSHAVASFADLVTSNAPLAGPLGLPAAAGTTVETRATGPLVSWLRPRGSAEAAGLLRRAVVDSLVARAGRERYEAVVFVAPSPQRTAASSALGQWVDRTALVVEPADRGQAESAAGALAAADVRVAEVVFT